MTKDLSTGLLDYLLSSSARALADETSDCQFVAIDVPIGLPYKGYRLCDRQARKLLGKRRSSVFSAPIRPVLSAPSWNTACEIARSVNGVGITKQAWAIVPKIKEVDLLLSASPEPRERIREVHPELCFAAWNSGTPMVFRKKKREGKEERARLIREVYGDEVLKEIRSKFLKKDVADDDLHDAFAALWTAERMSCNSAIRIPSDQEQIDANGLSMEMWY